MKVCQRLFVICILMGLVFAAPSQTSVNAVGAPLTLRVMSTSYPTTLDPQAASFIDDVAQLQLIYEGLTRLDEDLNTVPGAAASWAYNGDATQITFTLRGGLTYSDGALLNAMRFEYSILRLLDPTMGNAYASLLDVIIGAEAYRTADPGLPSDQINALRAAVDVRALDDSDTVCISYSQANCLKLRVKFNQPTPYFHTLISTFTVYPARQDRITAGGAGWWQTPANLVGNGPFVITSLSDTQSFLTPNPNYWGPPVGYNLAYRFENDTAARLQAYRNQQVDIIAPGMGDLAAIKSDPALNAQLLTYNGSCTFGVMFHHQKAPFTDPKVREAFAMAIDRSGLINDFLGGNGLPTLQWIVNGQPGYDPAETRWGYNPVQAQQALADSTYHNAQSLPVIKATFSDTTINVARWTWLAQRWQDVLGVTVVLEPLPLQEFNARVGNPATQPQMYYAGWCSDYPDPSNWMLYWKSDSYYAWRIGYNNPALDALINQADSETDPVTRINLYQQAQTLLIDGAPAAFLYNAVQNYLVKPWVHGYQTTPQDLGWPGIMTPATVTIDATQVRPMIFLPGVGR